MHFVSTPCQRLKSPPLKSGGLVAFGRKKSRGINWRNRRSCTQRGLACAVHKGIYVHRVFKTPLWRSAPKLDTDGMVQPVQFQWVNRDSSLNRPPEWGSALQFGVPLPAFDAGCSSFRRHVPTKAAAKLQELPGNRPCRSTTNTGKSSEVFCTDCPSGPIIPLIRRRILEKLSNRTVSTGASN